MESFFLKHLNNTGITDRLNDDCFHLKNIDSSHIIAADSFIENIHFYTKKKPYQNHTTTCARYNHPNDWLGYEDIARKAFLVNISDIISSNAMPKYAMLAITLSSHLKKTEILQIISGIHKICREFNITLIGGDTTKGDRLIFNITLIGKLMGKYIGRDSIRDGDLIAYTSARLNDIGGSLRYLTSLLRYGSCVNRIHNNIESNRFIEPKLRLSFMQRANRYINSCLDISDGLGSEIKRLQEINRLHFKPFFNINRTVFESGEEYELLFSFYPKHKETLLRIAKKCRISLHIIGRFTRCSKTYIRDIKWH